MRIPDRLKREKLPLTEAMMRIQETSSFLRTDVEQVIARLPKPLATAQAFYSLLDEKWRYEFGVPYEVETSVVVGTDQNPEVRILLCGLMRLNKLASCTDFDRYASRLNDESKHLNYLAELDPVLRGKELVRLDYEPRPLGKGSPGPDWAMEFADQTTCLVEVKSRIKELLKLFTSLRAGRDPSPYASRMPVIPGLLGGVSRKFPVLDPTSNALQGVWIYSPVWFIEDELQALFYGLDEKRVQFLVVGRAWREYESLTRDDISRQRLCQHYSLGGM